MGGPPPSPAMPKNPAGGPTGPGGSPALSPGGGAGNIEAARAQVKMMLEGLYQLQGAFPVDSDEFGAVQDAIRSLRSTFKKSKGNELVPAAIQQLAQQSREGKPFAAAPGAGVAGPKPGMGGPMGGAPPNMPPGM